MMSVFVMMPVLIVTTAFVYSREMESKNEPRPEFIDYPFLRRIIKVDASFRQTIFIDILSGQLIPISLVNSG